MFRIGLPLAARLPPSLGRYFAKMMGHLCARLDLDWRTLGLREHFVANRTRLAFQDISPGLDDGQTARLVRMRFENSVHEELEGHWLGMQWAGRFQCDFMGLDAIRDQMTRGQGIVLLTLHFDATLMGVAHMGLAGLKLNLMTSDVVEDARVLPVVQRYFHRKYAGIESSLNGGRALHVESHLKSFYRALRAGEGVVILGDAHALELDKGIVVDFLGRRRAIAVGAMRMAEKTGAPMAAFVCLRDANGGYRVVFSPVLWSQNGSHQENIKVLYSFLGAHISSQPERWWAADLLPGFIVVDA
jgi:lauroyl/myristoyl acyltransferase